MGSLRGFLGLCAIAYALGLLVGNEWIRRDKETAEFIELLDYLGSWEGNDEQFWVFYLYDVRPIEPATPEITT